MTNLLTNTVCSVSGLTIVITPDDINTSRKTLEGAFRDTNSDISAWWLVFYAQRLGFGWNRFSKKGIDNLYLNDELGYHVNNGGFQFYSLITDG